MSSLETRIEDIKQKAREEIAEVRGKGLREQVLKNVSDDVIFPYAVAFVNSHKNKQAKKGKAKK